MKEYEWLAHYKTTNYYDSRKEVPSPPGILKLHTLPTQYKVVFCYYHETKMMEIVKTKMCLVEEIKI
jgi:hypothetical protein